MKNIMRHQDMKKFKEIVCEFREIIIIVQNLE